MSAVGKSIEDLLAEMRGNPAGIRFTDACRVAYPPLRGTQDEGIEPLGLEDALAR